MTLDTVPTAGDAINCGPLWVSPTELCEVRLRGEPIRMSVAAMRLLAKLLEAGGRVVSRDELVDPAERDRLRPRGRAVDVRVFRLRKALGPIGSYIVSVPGLGYRVDVFGLSRIG
jgi:DNA-binding response OmpR family regulator